MSLFSALVKGVIGTKHERDMKRMQPRIQEITALEPALKKLSDAQLAAKTGEFKQALEQGASLDDILNEAFAVVREVSWRVIKLRHYDVQLIGGAVLHLGKIAEMKTGEGKTLAATLPVYLNALEGKGAHLITVNDYLARRDSEWMGPVYQFLGLSLGLIQHDMSDADRKAAYGADVTYGTNNEYGFDFLRDNMKYSVDGYVQRGHHFAIVDEVDSILVDEARTPLIISGPAEESTDLYYRIDKAIPKLTKEEDYTVEEKTKTVMLTEAGIERSEKLLGVKNLYDPANMDSLHHLNQALRAHSLFRRDVDYMLKDGQVIIVDEFTGRLMPGRRWSDGLHQAVEAKEGAKIERENQTLASITFQNYFRMYSKLSGMTGTADTEAAEFDNIYKLEVVVIPTNKDLIRLEHPDVIYRTRPEKYRAVVKEIEELSDRGQPVLVGTISIEHSELLSKFLKQEAIPHTVLNAKYHEMEADIVAQAGRKGAITIATNMAGRGTDILLGGNPEALAKKRVEAMEPPPSEEQFAGILRECEELCKREHTEVIELGGLHILGTERHESRRIDNQLRGRAGRQGDPGSSRFYLSLDDDVMRIFGGERVQNLMLRLGMEEDTPLEAKMVTNAIERAQKQVEAQNFASRKHLLEYDDVMNKQRKEMYRWRREILEGKGSKDYISTKSAEIVEFLLQTHAPEESDPKDWNTEELIKSVNHYFGIKVEPGSPESGKESNSASRRLEFDAINFPELREALLKMVVSKYEEKEQAIGEDLIRKHEQIIMLNIVDSLWKDHLYAMDHLKEGIGLRGYGQRDPLTEYKRESYEMFSSMREHIEDEIVKLLFHLHPVDEAEQRRVQERKAQQRERQLVFSAPPKTPPAPVVKSAGAKVGRNETCPCGSGKKFKRCHGSGQGAGAPTPAGR
jgi:preprotein translocase subunit SecA